MKSTKCKKCGKKIPKARLQAIPGVKTCVKCSDEEPLVGITIWSDSTPEVIIVKREEAEELKRLEKTEGCGGL